MITKRVVLVLGAGASKPYGFPLGGELFDKVVGDNSIDLTRKMREFGFSKSEFTKFKSELRKSLLPSVDAFLESHHEEFLSIGKAIMSYFLIKCEIEGSLYNSRNDQNWYKYLYNIMRSVDIDKFIENKISFITYNYDRSLEYSLFNALKSGWSDITDKKAATALENIPIIHIHGKLGELKDLHPHGRPYNNKITSGTLKIAMGGISIVHEDVDPAFSKAHKLLMLAEHVIFLGFGYNPKNIERLQLTKHLRPNAHVTGIVIGMTENEVHYNIRPLFEGIAHLDLKRDYTTVLEFLRENLHFFKK